MSSIWDWIGSKVGDGLFTIFGEKIVAPVTQAYLKSKNIDIKNQENADMTTISTAIVDANVKYAQVQEQYASNLMNWAFFRYLFGILMLFPVLHFCMAVADNSLVFFLGKPYGYFSVPPLHAEFGNIENQLLMTFVIVHGGGSIVSSIINKFKS